MVFTTFLSCLFHTVVTVSFREAGYTVSEGDSVELVVQKDSMFNAEIDFDITTSDGMFVGGGRFVAGGSDRVTTISVFFTPLDNDIALQDDVTVSMTLSLLTISPQIVLANDVIPVVIQDDEGKFRIFYRYTVHTHS